MERRIVQLAEKYPVVRGSPRAAWEDHFRRLAEAVLDRLDAPPPRRAHHGGGGLGPWVAAALARLPGGKHFVAPLPQGVRPPGLEAADEAGRVVWLDKTDPVSSLRAFPPRSLDLAAISWPVGRWAPTPDRPLVDVWLDTAFPALAPGRTVAVWLARDSSPELPLNLLRGILRGLDPRMDLPAGGAPDDPEELRRRLERAGFGEARAWAEGLTLGFSDGAAALAHFLELGGEGLLGAIENGGRRNEVRARLAEALDETGKGRGEVWLTFESLLGIARVPKEE